MREYEKNLDFFRLHRGFVESQHAGEYVAVHANGFPNSAERIIVGFESMEARESYIAHLDEMRQPSVYRFPIKVPKAA